jgi:nitrogen-specific signal transduction histidine kinase
MPHMKNFNRIRDEAARIRPSPATGISAGSSVHATVQSLKEFDHAFRTPVGAMVVAVELLQAATDEPTRVEAREVIGRQLQRVRELLDCLHELTRELEARASAETVKE